MSMRTLLHALLLLLLTCSCGLDPAQAQDNRDSSWNGNVYQDNIVVILDASGSMKDRMAGSGEVKMEAARRSLLAVLSKVPPTTNVGLLVFGGATRQGRALRKRWLYPLGQLDVERLRQAISEPQPGGKTWLGKFMKIGADRLLEQRALQKGYGTYRLLVVTDGEANDPGKVEKHVPDILSRGVTVDVIGVAMKENHTLATRINRYRRADDPESLERAISAVFAEIGTEGAQATDAAFELLEGFPLEVAAAALTALTTQDDRPIGQRATRRTSAAQQQPRAADNGSTTTSTHYTPPPQGLPTTTHHGRPSSTWRAIIKFVAMMIGLLVVGIIMAVVKQRRYR